MPKAACAAWCAVALASKVSALIVVNPASLITGRVYGAASFKYFGRNSESSLRGSGIVLDGEALCSVDQSRVHGNIVIIGDQWPRTSLSPKCNAMQSLGDIYESMERAGALAVVFISHLDFIPPGSLTFHYETWERCKFCDASTSLVHVDSDALDMLEEWRQHPDLEFELDPKAQDFYQRLFASFFWLASFRIFVPLVAFSTCIEAASEIYRILCTGPKSPSSIPERETRLVSLAVCCVEAPAMLAFGLAVGLGLYGPYNAPVQVLNMVYGAMQGSGILTTLVLGLHLAEEIKINQANGDLPRQSIFEKDRNVLLTIAILTLGCDLGAALLSYFMYYYVHRFKWFTILLMAVYTVLQGGAGLFFVVKANATQQPLIEYLRHVRTAGTSNSESMRKVGRLVFWLSTSAIFMIAASAGMCYSTIFMVLGLDKKTAMVWPFSVLYVILFRVLISWAQVNAVRPSTAAFSFAWAFAQVSRVCRRARVLCFRISQNDAVIPVNFTASSVPSIQLRTIEMSASI